MTPAAIAALALQLLQDALSIIGTIRGQAGMTDDEILAAASAQDAATQALIASYLNAAPPPAPPAV